VPAELPEQDRDFHSARHVPPDRHTTGRITTHAKDHHRLRGAEGSWSNDQLDVFRCKRCGSNTEGVLIPQSGYRLTRTIFTEAGQLKVQFRKDQFATVVSGLSAEPGLTPRIERVVVAPALTAPLPPIDFNHR
jgi:hypothetical protein